MTGRNVHWDERSAARLREMRKAAGLTQATLGRMAGLSVTGSVCGPISKYETARTAPTRKTLGRLACALGVDVGVLIEGVLIHGAAEQPERTAASSGWGRRLRGLSDGELRRLGIAMRAEQAVRLLALEAGRDLRSVAERMKGIRRKLAAGRSARVGA